MQLIKLRAQLLIYTKQHDLHVFTVESNQIYIETCLAIQLTNIEILVELVPITCFTVA